MPRTATDHDYTTLRIIESWKQAAADEVDNIGGWRGATKKQAARYWTGKAAIPEAAPPKQPDMFYAETVSLVGEITARYPKLDPTPLQEVYAAIAAWHEDRSAKRIPSQPVLFATLERAMMTLQAVECDIESRTVRKPRVRADDARTYKVSDVRELTGMGNTAINKYAKQAGAKTPPRGKRNHRYTSGEVRSILEAIIKNSSSDKDVAKCREALKSLLNPPEIA